RGRGAGAADLHADEGLPRGLPRLRREARAPLRGPLVPDVTEAAAAFERFEDVAAVCARLAAGGFTRLVVPAPGARVDAAAVCAAREALAYRSPMADSVLAVLGLGAHAVAAAGDAALRAR